MNIKIIIPDGMFYEGECNFVEFTSVEGDMGVYENHIPLTTILEPCVVKIHTKDKVQKEAVMGGFVEIQKDRVTILAEDANRPEDINIERAKNAEERARKRLNEKKADIDLVRAEAALKRALARIHAAK